MSGYAQVSVTTFHNDNSRSGQNTSETILTPANVNVNTFGKLFSQTVDAYVYAQPLYVPNVSIPGKGTHNVVYVATEHDSVYAFDADDNTGSNASPLWQASFINPSKGITTVSSGDVGCTDLVPEIGVTGTPVIDTTTGTLYVVAKTKERGKFFQRLHALDITTGAEKFGGPATIQAKVKGTGDGSMNGFVHFDPLRNGQRPGLLLQNGSVYISWASHCDNGPYHGWVISYDAQTLKQNGAWNATPNGGLGGFWASGAGIAADAGFNLYVATGNGTFDKNTGGSDFGDSIIKLLPPTANRFRPSDYFTPYNQQTLNIEDADLGSGGVLLLPDQTGPHKHLLVQAGKEGTIYLIDRDHMGHFNPNNNDQIVQSLDTAVGGMWAMPAWWNNNLYFGGSDDFVKTFTFNPPTGMLSTAPASESAVFIGFPGPTPSVSANGSNNGILWVLQTDDYGSGSATLRAFDAMNLANELYNSTQNPSRDDAGGAVKFTLPTIANGKVYVPAVQEVSVYGLLSTKAKSVGK
ncbi:MAG: pyrrolo-quinoline quinone [Acidobacteriia bacterium]|nr:pyrrolo-quinoline quinone [Terriglobia bacterium]